MLGLAVQGSAMTTQEDRGPLSTEISISDTDVDPQASGRCDSRTHDPNWSEAEAASDERLSIGERLSGRYRIERELGEGGMGVVYLVSDEQVAGETFAVKVLKEGLDPEALRLLREEVRKTRKLSHPNIVDMHSVNVDGSRLYVLMESLEGKSLNALLDEEFGRGMSFSHAWPIIEDVGAALGNAHDHNVIHSDLKPANVFVTNSGRTKLLDFGIARVSRGPLLQKWSGTRALTPAYASCEMLKGEEADLRDDIYSFACVIYEMLSGRRPFGELTALEAREAGAQVPPLQGLSREQNATLTQALAFDRDGRTASVEQLLEGLADAKPRARPIALLTGAVIATVAALSLTYLALDKLWISKRSVVVQSGSPEAQQPRTPVISTDAAFNPPSHSIAVLPFVNLSGDKDQEYFSEGLTEELLNSLVEINDLQVAARTSSFSFKEHPDIVTVAHKLNVAAVLEGSVRRSAQTVRVTAQLINAVTGFHLWSKTYDRNLGDVLKLQTEIATSVAEALKVTLLGDISRKIELGGTNNPAAFDAYLRGRRIERADFSAEAHQAAIAAYTEAIHLDPNYALAFAERSGALSNYGIFDVHDPTAAHATLERALKDAVTATTLAPELAEGYLALGVALRFGSLEFARADEAYERALALAPGSARVLASYSRHAAEMGRTAAALDTGRRAITLDPLNFNVYRKVGIAYVFARRYAEALASFQMAISLQPDLVRLHVLVGRTQYAMGAYEAARKSCEIASADDLGRSCLAITYRKLGRNVDAEAMLQKLKSKWGDSGALAYADIYAQWGDTAKALEWLEKAVRLRDSGLGGLKTDGDLDPLRNEPRFQAVMRELKFPE
jgi:TolB-like protein/Flp pilus assembly protein TadD